MKNAVESTLVRCGMRADWFGYRHVQNRSIAELRLRGSRGAVLDYHQLHPAEVATNDLPANVTSREQLPRERGWWGYSFHDVPERLSQETFVAKLHRCRIVAYRDPDQQDDFYPAIVTQAGEAAELPQIRFREKHAALLRGRGATVDMEQATWIAERVYHNHSHWLTAHLPKLLLLKQRGQLENVVLPSRRTDAIDASLKMLAMDPDSFSAFDDGQQLRVEKLTVVGTDRFRPELLRLVPAAFNVPQAHSRKRRIYISREGATRRRFLDEDRAWGMLKAAGFERVRMEDLTFAQQVKLMSETQVLCGPHGAGLTNMLFCPPGTDIIEIADLTFPNPNFYALASALGHRYWLLPGQGVGQKHPLVRDVSLDLSHLERSLRCLEESYCSGTPQKI